MEFIPLIYVDNRKIQIEKNGEGASLDDVLENIDKDKEIYFLDIDGIEKNKPNLCTYQKISDRRNIWVDTGPRTLGDIVDLLMAGTNKITIRPHLFPIKEAPSIKDITENMIYSMVDLSDEKEMLFSIYDLPGIDGLVFFPDKQRTVVEFQKEEVIKKLGSKYKIYVGDSDEKNISYWRKIGVSGLLLDLKNYKEGVS
jgi:hypothetical protein